MTNAKHIFRCFTIFYAYVLPRFKHDNYGKKRKFTFYFILILIYGGY